MIRAGSIPSSWLTITGVMSAEPNLALVAEVDRLGVAHDDIDAVKEVWQRLNISARARHIVLDERERVRRSEALADRVECRALDLRFPQAR